VISTYTASCSVANKSGEPPTVIVNSGIASGNGGCSALSDAHFPSQGHAQASFNTNDAWSAGSNELSASIEGQVGGAAAYDVSCIESFYFCGGASAGLSVEETLQFMTGGSARPGVLTYLAVCGFGPIYGGASDSVMLQVQGTTAACSTFTQSIPIQLGTDLTIELLLSAVGGAGSSDGGLASPEISFSGSLFEADGITPVGLFDVPMPDTPEPATILLLASAGSLMTIRRTAWHATGDCGNRQLHPERQGLDMETEGNPQVL
jgi:hypothetical protein